MPASVVFVCSYCGAVFPSSEQLRLHRSENHSQSTLHHSAEGDGSHPGVTDHPTLALGASERHSRAVDQESLRFTGDKQLGAPIERPNEQRHDRVTNGDAPGHERDALPDRVAVKSHVTYALAAAAVAMYVALMATGLGSVSPLRYPLSGLALFIALVLPGFLLLRLLGFRATSVSVSIAYSVAVSLVTLMLLGLAVNTLLPVLGISRPLATTSLVIALAALFAMLFLLLAVMKTDLSVTVTRPHWSTRNLLLFGVPPLFVLFSVMGATSLNNGGSNVLVLVLMTGIAIYALWLLLSKSATSDSAYSYSLYFFCLSLLLSVSLRGWVISGHDILTEYKVFELTKNNLRWNMAFYRDAYNACISITILPTMIAKYAQGIPDAYVLRVVFQMVASFIPIAVFHFSRKYVNKGLAYLAVIFFVSQSPFLRDFAYMTRQEIATLFYAMILLTLATDQLSTRLRTLIVVLLGVGMVLSHYSTTYVAIAVFSFCAILNAPIVRGVAGRAATLARRILTRVFPKAASDQMARDVLEAEPDVETLIHRRATWLPGVWLIVFLLAFAVVWNVWITGTAQNLTSFADTAYSNLTGRSAALANQTSLLDQFMIFSGTENEAALIKSYAASTVGGANTAPGARYAAQSYDSYSPQIHVNVFLRGKVQPTIATGIYTLGELVQKLIKVLILVGAMWLLALAPSARRGIHEIKLLVFANLSVLLLAMVLPAISSDYDLMRAYQQTLVVLCIPAMVGSIVALSYLSRSRAYRLTIALFVAYYLFLSPVLPQEIGSGYAHLQLNNFGLYYNLYYTHESEWRSIEWLSSHDDGQSPVFSDWYAGKKIAAFSKSPLWTIDNVLPWNLTRSGYVYVDYTDNRLEAAYVFYQGRELNYRFPSAFLRSQKDTIYSNGETAILK